ncbi:MAG: XRE family transcriptional regulator [Bacilli bacterium]|jgi:repressor LexA|nr:XRE family transcriptional regulator [Bacilli bacterium]
MFGSRMKKLRESKKINQKTLANELGISQHRYSNYEREKRQPEYDILLKIAKYFNVTVDYLLGYEIDINKIKISKEKDIVYIPFLKIDKNVLVENQNNNFAIPKKWIVNNISDYFITKSIDNSMIDENIVENSLLLFIKQSELNQKAIGIFKLNNKIIIKRFSKINNSIILESANSSYDPIIITKNDDFTIIGKLLKIIISYEE